MLFTDFHLFLARIFFLFLRLAVLLTLVVLEAALAQKEAAAVFAVQLSWTSKAKVVEQGVEKGVEKQKKRCKRDRKDEKR